MTDCSMKRTSNCSEQWFFRKEVLSFIHEKGIGIKMDTFIFVIEIMGTIAFAVSGALTGIEKKMDVFGVVILGLTTAVGGGIIRDLIIGCTPPQTFRNPVYAKVAIVTALVVFFLAYFRNQMFNKRYFELLIFVMDTLGLGIFTVVGINNALNSGHHFGNFLLIFVGVLTGVGGGVLRDMLAGNIPYIFEKHIYACSSLLGALAYVYGLAYMRQIDAMLLGVVVVVIGRVVSAHFRLNLPKIK